MEKDIVCKSSDHAGTTYTWNFGSTSLDECIVFQNCRVSTTISLHGSLAAIREDLWDDLLKPTAVVLIWFCLKRQDSMVAWNIYDTFKFVHIFVWHYILHTSTYTHTYTSTNGGGTKNHLYTSKENIGKHQLFHHLAYSICTKSNDRSTTLKNFERVWLLGH